MLAFHNDKKIKQEYLNRVKAHQKADEIVKGQYWQNGHGCAVGCTIHGSDHGAYERELGIPRVIARLEDGIFENLPSKEAKAFPAKFLNAIKPGADLSQVADKFLHWLLVDETDGVIKYAKTDKQRKAIQDIGDMYGRKIGGEVISSNTWRDLKDAAYAAAYADAAAYAAAADAAADAAAYADAADAAADAAAYADAADAAADAAAYAAAADAAAYAAAADADAADAAYAAAYAAYAAAYARTKARDNSRIRQMNKLLELLKNAPVVKQIP